MPHRLYRQEDCGLKAKQWKTSKGFVRKKSVRHGVFCIGARHNKAGKLFVVRWCVVICFNSTIIWVFWRLLLVMIEATTLWRVSSVTVPIACGHMVGAVVVFARAARVWRVCVVFELDEP